MIAIDETGDKILLGRGVSWTCPIILFVVLAAQTLAEEIPREVLFCARWIYRARRIV